MKFTDFISWLDQPKNQHLVDIFKSSDELINKLVLYLVAGAKAGERSIVIARRHHVRMLKQKLADSGQYSDFFDLNEGNNIILSAESLLDDFMTGHRVNENKFNKIIGGILDDFCAPGQGVRAYGELVALLWERGDETVALEVEALWNKLAKKHKFALYCGYAQESLKHIDADKKRIAHSHDHVAPAFA